MRPRHRRAPLLAALIALGSCGYQANDEVQQIPTEDLFGLNQTTTTSTTTTTTTTTVASSVEPAESTSTTEGPTTTAVLTEPVELFYLDGTQMTSISQNLSSPTSLTRVLDALVTGPNIGPAGFGLRSLLPRGIINRVSLTGGVATVDLNPDAYDRIRPNEELPAIAQIVLTLTRQSGVGQVRFTLDGDPLRVRLGNNRITEPGDPVSFDDYANLLTEDVPDTVPEDSTEPASTSTSSPAPPGSAPTTS